jgi:hypothetical protein
MNPVAPDTEHDDVSRYAAAVRAALDDLPAEVRVDLLEDIEDHLREVAADGEGSLTDRLGPPEGYAEELRSSAGLPARTAPSRRPSFAGLRALADHRWVRPALAFLPELRPAWWIVRAYLVVRLLGLLTGSSSHRFWPVVYHSRLLGLVLFVLAAVGSVALGRRGLTGRQAVAVRLADAALGVVALVLLLDAFGGGYDAQADQYPYQYSPPADVMSEDGGPIANIYPYGPDGRPLTGVRLYNQDGVPIVLSDPGMYVVVTDPPLGPDGMPITNVYPQPRYGGDPALTFPPLPSTSVPTTTATPTPTPTKTK